MKIYTCKDRLEDIMTCIYDAWADALLIGHASDTVEKRTHFSDNIIGRIYPCRWWTASKQKKSPGLSAEIFLPEHICTGASRIPFSRRRRTADNLDNFLRVGFAMGAGVLENYTNPHVMRIIELYRSVGNESHHFREFARFQSLDGRVYVSHLEPESRRDHAGWKTFRRPYAIGILDDR